MTTRKTMQPKRLPGGIDSDYAWLKTHLDFVGAIDSRERVVRKVLSTLRERVDSGRLPNTLGVFGGWGTGKTTFLAIVACESTIRQAQLQVVG